MEKVESWVLVLCCGCVLFGILENLLPSKGPSEVIKMAAAVYILLILLSPIQTLVKNDTQWQIPESTAAKQNQTEDGFAKKTEKSLELELARILAAAGQMPTELRVEMTADKSEIKGVTIRIKKGEGCDEAKIRELCDNALGFAAAYEFYEGQ